MGTLYACIIRTSDDDILTDIIVRDNWLDLVGSVQGSVDTEVMEIHMCAIADVDGEPSSHQRDEAIRWITRHLS